MRGAEPGLARILNRYAASLPAPPPVTWYRHSQRLLARSIEAGGPSLESVASAAALARQLAYSDPRSLRRALRRWDSEAAAADDPT